MNKAIVFQPTKIYGLTRGGAFNTVRSYIYNHLGITSVPKISINHIVKTNINTFEELEAVPNPSPLTCALFGTKNQANILKTYSEQLNSIITSGSFNCEFDNYTIKGRYDGYVELDNKKFIVEVKTRTKNEFGIKRNELIQCIIYCKCMGIDNLLFVEQGTDYKLRVNSEQNVLTEYSILLEETLKRLDMLALFIKQLEIDSSKYIINQQLDLKETIKMLYWV